MGRDQRQGPRAMPSMTDFARMVGEGHIGARDRFGNQIKRGHLVTYRSIEADPVYEVVDVSPILDPRQPGMVKVTLQGIIPLRLMVNQSAQVLMIIGESAQAEKDRHITPPNGQPGGEDMAKTAEAAGVERPTLVITDADRVNDAPTDEGGAQSDDEPPAGDDSTH